MIKGRRITIFYAKVGIRPRYNHRNDGRRGIRHRYLRIVPVQEIYTAILLKPAPDIER